MHAHDMHENHDNTDKGILLFYMLFFVSTGQALFSNIEILKDLNESMLHDIESSIVVDIKTKKKKNNHVEQLLGEVLGRYAPFFSMYNDYITSYHKNVLQVFQELENSSSGGGGSSSSNSSSSGNKGKNGNNVRHSGSGSIGNNSHFNEGKDANADTKEDIADNNSDSNSTEEDDYNTYSSMNFKEYCNHVTKNNPRCRQLNLKSFLIMPIQRVPRYVLLLQELIKQIHKVLNVQKEKEKQTNNSHQHQPRTKHHSSSKARYHLKQELMFYKGLEEEKKKIEQALTKFKSVARQIDSKIMEVSYRVNAGSLTCA